MNQTTPKVYIKLVDLGKRGQDVLTSYPEFKG